MGYSYRRLQHWLQNTPADRRSAAELIRSAMELAKASKQRYEIVTPLLSLPEPRLAKGTDHWLDKPALTTWMAEHSFTVRGKPVGAFRYLVWARDPEAAVQTAAVQLDKAAARASFTPAKGELAPLGLAFVAGVPKPLELGSPERSINLVSLVKEAQIYEVGLGELHVGVPPARNALDDALEQPAALNRRALAPALTGAWVALESLLTEVQVPKDPGRVVAATRAAAIVACS